MATTGPWTKVLVIGLLTTLLGLTTWLPPLNHLEINQDLDWLFTLRGPRPAPEEVVIVAIDRNASNRLGLPNDPRRWPRSLHAELIRSLSAQGASTIVFDLFFQYPAPDPAQDQRLAQAMRETGNVILVEDLKQRLPAPAGLYIEDRIYPTAELAAAAAATAPFPLPKRPIRVNRSWLFKTGAGDIPTLPVMAFHVYAHDSLPALPEPEGLKPPAPAPPALLPVSAAEPGALMYNIQTQRNHLRLPSAMASPLSREFADPAALFGQDRHNLQALRDLYSGPAGLFLDFYGPPRTLRTIPYDQALQAGPEETEAFRGKAVFVGVSENFQPEQREDGFYTVFTREDGLDLSGVEILATVFANLLERRTIRPLSPGARLMLEAAWALGLGAAALLLPGTALPVVIVAAGAYLGGAWYLFERDALWLPVTVPLLLQLPCALLLGLLWRYRDNRREKWRVRKAFGYYLPEPAVDRLLEGPLIPETWGERVQGVCLASDAERYTLLSETLPPEQLHTLLNRYYAALFRPVRERGGFVSDVVGDAMLALWAVPVRDGETRLQACLAALEIMTAVEVFNRHYPHSPLPTRLGLHCGDIMLGNVGAGDHFEYRAVGDVVNATNRIQSFNKRLGTRILAAREVVEGLPGLVTREAGTFTVAGKVQPLTLCELICTVEQGSTALDERLVRFAEALAAFRSRHWQQANRDFTRLLNDYPDEGPARYYLQLCNHYARHPPPPDWNGVADLERRK